MTGISGAAVGLAFLSLPAMAAAELFSDWTADELAYALFEPDRLPAERRSELDGLFCATPIARALDARRSELSSEAAAVAAAPRKTDHLDASLETDHFILNYATSGDAQIPGWPDPAYRDSLASYFETAYRTFTEDPRFRLRPPLGSEVPGSDGLPRISVYVEPLDPYFGLAHDWPAPGTECTLAAFGWIRINTQFVGHDLHTQARLTSAHEVFHLVQGAVNWNAGDFLQESTATWASDLVWPDFTEWIWSAWMFWSTHRAPWSAEPSQYTYAASLLWHFLDARIPAAGPRRIASRVVDGECVEDWRVSLVREVEAHGLDLDTLIHDFGVWNYYARDFDDGRHYPDAGRLGPVRTHAVEYSYPVEHAAFPGAFFAGWAGTNHLRLDGTPTRRDLRIAIEGHPGIAGRRSVTAIATTVNGGHIEHGPFFPDAAGNVEVLVPDWHLRDLVEVIVTNAANLDGALPDSVLPYTYSVEESGEATTGASWLVPLRPQALRAAPDPFVTGVSIRFAVEDGAARTRLVVRDIAGREVRVVEGRRLATGEHIRSWDGRDGSGRRVASGTYYVVFENGKRRTVEAVTVLR